MDFHLFTRVAVRSILIQQGAMRGAEIVRSMGLDPSRHKGTIHAVLVDLETAGTLSATRHETTGKREHWSIQPEAIRKRDRLIAALIG
jgi:DNA-binding PadR family transcriptional regulator